MRTFPGDEVIWTTYFRLARTISWAIQAGTGPASLFGMEHYEDFMAWQLTHALNRRVFEMTAKPPACNDFKFRDNLRDAADSAEHNFPEGLGRFSPGDFARFLDNSRASLLETKSALKVGYDRKYFTEKDFTEATTLTVRALGALSGLQPYLRSPRAKLNAQRARERFIDRQRQPGEAEPKPPDDSTS
jgi:four helix bundle protein